MIGILAGMGPKSTGPFTDTVVEQCQRMYGARHDMEFPHMMIYSCPTPFYLDRPVDHAAMEMAIIDGARRLECTGVDFIAIPCNTAHLYYENIKASVSVPVINMVEETLLQLPENTRKVVLLATSATFQSGIYQRALEKRGVEVVQQEHWQHQVNEMITTIKTGQTEEAAVIWKRLNSEVVELADVIILACTDLNVLVKSIQNGLAVLDSSACLAQATVKQYLRITGPKLSEGKAQTYNKLVRDRIPDIIRAAGKQCLITVLNEAHYKKALLAKLREEAQEYFGAQESEDSLEELADLLEVIRALAAAHGATWEELEALRSRKAEARGVFLERVYLMDVDN